MSSHKPKIATLDEIKKAIEDKNFASVKICISLFGAYMWFYWADKHVTRMRLSPEERGEIEKLLEAYGLCQWLNHSRGQTVAQYGPRPW